MVGGRISQKFCRRPRSSVRRNDALRLRCDERGLKQSTIEIIAGQKVAPAFEATEGERKDGPSIPVQCYGCLRSSRVVVLRVF
jgi:hypothetical protein